MFWLSARERYLDPLESRQSWSPVSTLQGFFHSRLGPKRLAEPPFLPGPLSKHGREVEQTRLHPVCLLKQPAWFRRTSLCLPGRGVLHGSEGPQELASCCLHNMGSVLIHGANK